MAELSKNIREMKTILYGNSDAEPVPEACAQLTQEFFRENTLRLLIKSLPKLNLEVSTRRLLWVIVDSLTSISYHVSPVSSFPFVHPYGIFGKYSGISMLVLIFKLTRTCQSQGVLPLNSLLFMSSLLTQ